MTIILKRMHKELHPKQYRTCPVILCDTCHTEIDDFKKGVVLWKVGQEDNYIIVDKGKCDKESYEFSMELGHFIVYLLHNIKMSARDMNEEKMSTFRLGEL